MSEPLFDHIFELAQALLTEDTLRGDLERIAAVAVRTIPPCHSVSIALLAEGRPETVVATDRVSLEADLVQYDSDEGPCLTALQSATTIRVDYVATDERFPHFAVGARRLGINSVHSVPLRHGGAVVGTMNLYSRDEAAFDDEAHAAALVLAAQAGVAVGKSAQLEVAQRLVADAQHTADDASEVAVAEGVLMAVQQCTAEQAAGLLSEAAGANHESLVAVARRIIADQVSHRGSDAEPPTA